jgi:hypothetical protein
MSNRFGVIYPAYGSEYVLMAANSCLTLKKFNPSCTTELVTNIPSAADCAKLHDIFDRIRVQVEPDRNALFVKIKSLIDSPYDRTLILDADTEIMASIVQPIQVLLEQYDLGISLRITPAKTSYELAGLPDQKWFSHWNTGVIFFNGSDVVRALGKYWLDIHTKESWRADQPSFAKAVYGRPGIRIISLDVSWNYLPKYHALSDQLGSDVKIDHYVEAMNRPDVAVRILSLNDHIARTESEIVADSLCLDQSERRRYRLLSSVLYNNPLMPRIRRVYNGSKAFLGIDKRIKFLHKRRAWKG